MRRTLETSPKLFAIFVIPVFLVGCFSLSSSSVYQGDPCGVIVPAIEDPQLNFELLIDNFDGMLYLTHAGDGSGRIFLVFQDGQVHILEDGEVNRTPFLDIEDQLRSGGEQGLLSIAFHPEYESNGRFYVSYTRDGDGASVISEFRVSVDANLADMTTEQVILTVSQPFSNHNGGLIKFGPDGYLYIGLGDGGSGGDPLEHGQNRATLLGSLLRIDVDNLDDQPYTIPADNPFVGLLDVREEAFAYGLRNPWRFSFDRCDGRLFLGDVGQSEIEEVDLIESGANYGWNTMEGSDCFDPSFNCNSAGLELPIAEYRHGAGNCSITGGYVYRGENYPSLQGHYIYGDFCTGQIWTLFQNADGEWINFANEDTDFTIASFGEDEAGELYIVDIGGAIYRITD